METDCSLLTSKSYASIYLTWSIVPLTLHNFRFISFASSIFDSISCESLCSRILRRESMLDVSFSKRTSFSLFIKCIAFSCEFWLMSFESPIARHMACRLNYSKFLTRILLDSENSHRIVEINCIPSNFIFYVFHFASSLESIFSIVVH